MERQFTPSELIQNSDFIYWAKTGRETSFSWSEWMSLNEENRKICAIAKSIILSIDFGNETIPADKMDILWKSIDEKTRPNLKEDPSS